MALGVVKFFKQEKGVGAISSAELPPGRDAFVHFSVIEADGFRFLHEGDQVEFTFEPSVQDSFRYSVTWVRKL
jgi:CspA family cold shock protein